MPLFSSPSLRFYLLLFSVPTASSMSVGPQGPVTSGYVTAHQQGQKWQTSFHSSDFAEVSHTARSNCAATMPPQAVATPDPLFVASRQNRKVTVDFIIGIDGRVHSPFVLEGADPALDRRVLVTVLSWHYRPAMCDGAPAETEAKIEFSSR